jgi:GNAT superfamily N-acetyltransferase
MTAFKVDIVPFQKKYQPAIDLLMAGITNEFAEPIAQPKPASDIPQLPDKYFVALINDTVAGTISITKLGNGHAVLKRMFVNKIYRGNGIATLLLNNTVNWAVENNVTAIFLGTMVQFKTAQHFYERHGFEKIELADLPIDFPVNPVDSIFYKKLSASR